MHPFLVYTAISFLPRHILLSYHKAVAGEVHFKEVGDADVVTYILVAMD